MVRLSRRPGIVTPRARQFHWFAGSAQEPVNQGFEGCLRWPSGRIAVAMICNVGSTRAVPDACLKHRISRAQHGRLADITDRLFEVSTPHSKWQIRKDGPKRKQLRRYERVAAQAFHPEAKAITHSCSLKDLWVMASKGNDNVAYFTDWADPPDPRPGIAVRFPFLFFFLASFAYPLSLSLSLHDHLACCFRNRISAGRSIDGDFGWPEVLPWSCPHKKSGDFL